ncbi:unnamed protein product [Mytilus edulis]|uniref:Uncharacterized protein n=1 Tax=Mytilus edulis TaxID=6550 RepID=A0A8S3U6U7_MYTED|nr:unnamed protein product [Mytilus edulis]
MGQPIVFDLIESKVGTQYKPNEMTRGKQILITVQENGRKRMPAYKEVMPSLEQYYPSADLARAMLDALEKKQDEQSSKGIRPDIIRPAALFLLITHIADSAVPFKETMEEYKKKTGRIPMGDKIVRAKLRNISQGKESIKRAFSEENFPIRSKDGTSKARTWVLSDEHGSSTGDLSDTDTEEDKNNGEERNNSEMAINNGSVGNVVEAESEEDSSNDDDDELSRIVDWMENMKMQRNTQY